MVNNPLVSVIVITYNSADYVVETLESIKNQTYKNIELIISDDSSRDDTVHLCESWLSANRLKFQNTQLISVPSNTGLSANVKRAVDAAKGEWVKVIAGDDLLIEDCIENYIKLSLEKEFDWAVSAMKKLEGEHITDFVQNQKEISNFFELGNKERYLYYLLNPFFLNPPSGFYRTKVLQDAGILDISFKLLEDQPIFLNLMNRNHTGMYLKKTTVIYRKNPSSITQKYNPNFFDNLLRCYIKYRKPYIGNSFLKNCYKKSVEGRLNWLLHTYRAKSKLEILQSFIWEKFNDQFANFIFFTHK